ncbi:MAG TPA: TadE family protein [Candidatus Dormibacteraeota bacterium]|nr:TadE family protein [Candidatus Dormibacteraeota bacterium]
MKAEGRTFEHRPKQKGQSLVEFAISSTVLLLLAMGLIDLSRAFYYSVALQGAAREGARHGAWFNTAARKNGYLDDADVMLAVNQALAGAGLSAAQQFPGACLTPTDSNTAGDKPYPQSAYPTTPQTVFAYVCYTNPNGTKYSSLAPPAYPPPDNSWRLGDINVELLMNFQLITPFIQGIFGNSLYLAYNEHFTIQGKP